MHWALELRTLWRRDFFTAIHLDADSVKREVEHFARAVSRHERRRP